MEISTSILDSDNRIDSVNRLNHTHTNYIHVDVMDGEFVSKKAFENVQDISAINRVSNRPLDVHLMVEDPNSYIEKLQDMNIKFVTFHIEVDKDISKIIQKIKDSGYQVGIAVSPKTDLEKLEPYLDQIDMILLMSVEPGMGGQKILPNIKERIKQVREMIKKSTKEVLIEVDGGINQETIDQVMDSDIIVVGSYIIKSDNYYQKIEELLKIDSQDEKSLSETKKETSIGKIIVKIIGEILIVLYFGFPFLMWLSIIGLGKIGSSLGGMGFHFFETIAYFFLLLLFKLSLIPFSRILVLILGCVLVAIGSKSSKK